MTWLLVTSLVSSKFSVNSTCVSYPYWSHHFKSFTVATMAWLITMEYMCHKWPMICSTCRKHLPVSFSHSWLITGFLTKLTSPVLLVE
jgi:hypothetical protein